MSAGKKQLKLSTCEGLGDFFRKRLAIGGWVGIMARLEEETDNWGLDLTRQIEQEFLVKNHRKSLVKRARKSGFRARQRTNKGRAVNNRKRSSGRTVGVKRSFS